MHTLSTSSLLARAHNAAHHHACPPCAHHTNALSLCTHTHTHDTESATYRLEATHNVRGRAQASAICARRVDDLLKARREVRRHSAHHAHCREGKDKESEHTMMHYERESVGRKPAVGQPSIGTLLATVKRRPGALTVRVRPSSFSLDRLVSSCRPRLCHCRSIRLLAYDLILSFPMPLSMPRLRKHRACVIAHVAHCVPALCGRMRSLVVMCARAATPASRE